MDPSIKTPRQQSWNVTLQRQIGEQRGCLRQLLGSYSDRLWNVLSLNQGVVHRQGRARCRRPTGPQFFPTCTSTNTLNLRRELTMQNFDQGKFLGCR